MSDATSQIGHNWQPHVRHGKPDSVFHQNSYVVTPITCCSVHHHQHHCLIHNRPILCHRHCRRTQQTPVNIDHLLKEELLQIRRKMVARTASPKVVNRLSYLLPSNKHKDKTVETHVNDNLPGEIWV